MARQGAAGSWSRCRRGQCIKLIGSLSLCVFSTAPPQRPGCSRGPGVPIPPFTPPSEPFSQSYPLPSLPTVSQKPEPMARGLRSPAPPPPQGALSWVCSRRPVVQLETKHAHLTPVTLCRTASSCWTLASAPQRESWWPSPREENISLVNTHSPNKDVLKSHLQLLPAHPRIKCKAEPQNCFLLFYI